jgi:hypothetical protein
MKKIPPKGNLGGISEEEVEGAILRPPKQTIAQ